MAAGFNSAANYPEADSFVSPRQAPATPATPTTPTTPTSFADEPGPRRRRSFVSLLRRSSSQLRQHQQSNSQGVIPPVPALPPSTPVTRIAQAHHAAALERSSFDGRKTPVEGGRTMLRKSSKLRQEQERLERVARLNAPAPRLPSHNPLPGIDTFDENHSANRTNFSRPAGTPYSTANMPKYDSAHNSSSSPAYAVKSGTSPPGTQSGEYVERHESMTNRGRYSYASSMVGVNMNSPRRVRRRKDPTPFNVLVVGAKNSGKTSFISFLRHSLALPACKSSPSPPEATTVKASKSSFTSHYLETEMESERVGLTLWDSAGLEKNIVDLQLREVAAFVESKFEETFVEEQKVMRSPGVKDTHIHCVILILDPVRLDTNIAAAQENSTMALGSVNGLDDQLDLQVMRSLWGKTTVIPVISKADTLTIGHMAFLKRAVWHSIRTAKMDPLEALELEDEMAEEDSSASGDDTNDSDASLPKPSPVKKSHNRHSSITIPLADDGSETPYIPMSILSPDPYDLPPYRSAGSTGPVGRRFPWGLADPNNDAHCDFSRLRDSIFLEWRGELRELSRSRWYEGWRTSRLKNLGAPGARRGWTPVGASNGTRSFSGGNGAHMGRVNGGSNVTNGSVVAAGI